MKLFQLGNWPILFILLGMIVCAVIDGWKRIVPNWLTYPLIFSGWAFAICNYYGLQLGASANGDLLTSFLATLAACLGLLPVVLFEAMGEGDLKMLMGFGAWIGAFYGWGGELPDGQIYPSWMWVLWWSYADGVLLGGVMGIIIIIVRKRYKQYMENTRAIIQDVAEGSLSKMEERGRELRRLGPKLPYGVPLCIGMVIYLLYLYR